MFERYTESARRAIFFAHYEAAQTGSPYIESLHLLLGVTRESGLMFKQANPEFSVNDVTEACRDLLPRGNKKISTSVDLPLSNECKRTLAYAAEAAEVQQMQHITPVHLVLGLIRASEAAASILKNHGITPENLASVKTEPAARRVRAAGYRDALIEFMCAGGRIASTPASGLAPIPLVGEELAFTRDSQIEAYKVISVRHHYEGAPQSEFQTHCWLSKIVVELERLSPASGPLKN